MRPTQPTSQNSDRPRQPRLAMHPRVQSSLFALVGCSLVLSWSYWLIEGGHRGELIEIDRADPLEAQFQVDINKAQWPELIQLPGLGETLARRMVSDRLQNGEFRSLEDLRRVNGIGVKTLDRLRPYLLPILQDTDWAAAESLPVGSSDQDRPPDG